MAAKKLDVPLGVPRMADPVEVQAVRLLKGRLLIQTSRGLQEITIKKVQPYIHVQDDGWSKQILEKGGAPIIRRPGEVMVLPGPHGSRLLFLVVDQENQQRIVRMKNFEYGGVTFTLGGLLKALDWTPKDLDKLDGQLMITADESAQIRLQEDKRIKVTLDDIHQKTEGAVQNCLGVWSLIKKRPE